MTVIQFGPLQVTGGPDTLEPRLWTLAQAEWAADLAATAPSGLLAEVFCGVGHIGQAAAVLAGRSLVQVDVSEVAVERARANAQANAIADRVEVRCADVDTAFRPAERFPIILADPPYLPTAEVERWPSDPVLAIDGGADGLEVHRRCLPVLARHLEPEGVALLQMQGRAQADALAADLERAGLACAEVRAHDEHRAVALIVRF